MENRNFVCNQQTLKCTCPSNKWYFDGVKCHVVRKVGLFEECKHNDECFQGKFWSKFFFFCARIIMMLKKIGIGYLKSRYCSNKTTCLCKRNFSVDAVNKQCVIQAYQENCIGNYQRKCSWTPFTTCRFGKCECLPGYYFDKKRRFCKSIFCRL